jgi:hypothetical protein
MRRQPAIHAHKIIDFSDQLALFDQEEDWVGELSPIDFFFNFLCKC